jgi:hypothetical protein
MNNPGKVLLMKRRIVSFCWLMGLLVLACLSVHGQGQAEAKPLFCFDFSHRFRFTSWDNAVHLDSSKNSNSTFTRFRTSLGTTFFPADWLEFRLKLTNEFRIFVVPDRDFNMNELFVDNLYMKVKRPGSLPLSFTLGRQNIMLGEGFVVMDGHPLDGSRSIYFNAARMDLFLKEGHKLILFYTFQPETDSFLPLINDFGQPLIEQPEEGIGLYYTGRFRRMSLDSYVIRKNIRSTKDRPISSEINTMGARLVIPVAGKLSLSAEAAYQSGTYGGYGRSVFGGYLHGDWKIDSVFPLPHFLSVGGIFLSGDDPSTAIMEGWDPLFSRWPKWSESLILTLIPEYGGRVAYWSNFASLYETLKFKIAGPVETVFTYHYLIAPRASVKMGSFSGGGGTTRGGLLISKLIFKINRSLTGHIWWERFDPGNYYRADADTSNWFRVELLIKF